MRLAPGINKVRDYPTKLKELVIQRTLAEYSWKTMEHILENKPSGLFSFVGTPEGGTWWFNVQEGREFGWEEGIIDKWAVKVPTNREPSIVKFFEEKNPTRSPHFTEGYYYHFPIYDGNSNASNRLESGYREISFEEFKRIAGVKEEKKEEIPVQSKEASKFKIGDFVRYKDEHCSGEAYIANYNSSYGYLVEIGVHVRAYYDKQGNNGYPGTCRWFSEKDLQRASTPTEAIKSIEKVAGNTSASIQDREWIDWERLRSVRASAVKPDFNAYTWGTSIGHADRYYRRMYPQIGEEYSYKSGSLSLDKLTEAIGDMFYGKQGVEKMQEPILINRKKTKRRNLI